MDAPLNFLEILKVLTRHRVDFILVGGVAAILEGAPISTFDLDVMIRPTSDDRNRLLEALSELNARCLDPAGRHILPDQTKLETLRLQRLVTDFGPLDVLETIGDGLKYSDLAGETEVYEVGGLALRALRLEAIILSKEQAGREKDLAALPILRRTLQLKRGGSQGG
jgi:predicted nucleotidyltransferase